MSAYKVISPLVVVPNADKVSGDGYFYKDAVVPRDWNPERCKQLAEEGMLEAVTATASAPEPSTEADKPAKVNDVLAEVGDDKEKAAAALETEKARGDAARPTLVEKLQAVLDAS